MPEATQTDRLLAALQRKQYFAHRFAKQVVQVFSHSVGDEDVRVRLFVNELIGVIPDAVREDCVEQLIRKVVNEWTECPSVSDIRALIAEAVLASAGETFETLMERARLFVHAPPTNPGIAERWLEKVLWTSVRKIGRERFAVTTTTEWKQAVTRAIMLDEPLIAFEPSVPVVVPTAKRDYRSLLPRHD
ncbi:hypothetical protein [Cupriavidus pampae]|uniref:Uncharacterized protein n=1 Tax=Cupriavidus pampae TaxID=659251 RepID=A0ABM8XV24_9BURK|nr:hypothetical protein [Cupriavidus pampae]CAG9184218.1 hypothetical protein LMG32289_05560 [Cupriavidus pampae]